LTSLVPDGDGCCAIGMARRLSGEVSFAKRHLPRTPTRNVGAFRLAPTPPNDSKGRGSGPSPLDTPPRGRGALAELAPAALSEAESAERGAGAKP